MNDQWCSDQTISDLPARASAFHVPLHRGVIVSALFLDALDDRLAVFGDDAKLIEPQAYP